MTDKHDPRWAMLAAPPAIEDVQFKIESIGRKAKQASVGDTVKVLASAYIDARTVIERLNTVFPGEWYDEYRRDVTGTTVECALTVAGVTRRDVGLGDDPKAQYSDALKRAAVKFGIGLPLYRLPKLWCWAERWGPKDSNFDFSNGEIERLRRVVADAWGIEYHSPHRRSSHNSKNSGREGKNTNPPKNAPQKPAQAATGANARPLSPEALRDALRRKAEKYAGYEYNNPHGARGVLVSVLDGIVRGETNRHALTDYLVGQPSTQHMSDAQVRALLDWLGLDDGGKPHPMAVSEAHAALLAAMELMDIRARHNKLYVQARDAGLIDAQTAKEWGISPDASEDEIAEKVAALEAALSSE